MSITVGQLTSAAKLLAVDLTAHPGLPDFSNLSQDAEVVEDVMAIVAVFWPPMGLILEAFEVACALAPYVIAAGVKPDPDPIHDAQTTMGRGGRSP